MSDEQVVEPTEPETTMAESEPSLAPAEAPQYGVGPFTLREVALVGVWLIAFVVSFFPVYTNVLGTALGGGLSVWTAGLDWILTIGAPTVAVFLIVLRRLSPDGIRRVGSLGVDQFASVAFAVSATVWLVYLWNNITVVISNGVWVRTWVVWTEFFLILAGVVLTVLAAYIPPFSQDFRGRPDAQAHRNARPVRPVTARPPRPVQVREPAIVADPSAPPPAAPLAEASAYDALGLADTDAAGHEDALTPAEPAHEWAPQYARGSSDTDEVSYPDTGGYRRSGAVAAAEPAAEAAAVPAAAVHTEPEPARNVHQAFWALAPVERDVYDERGVPAFRIGPTAWALVIEDRGTLFVIRHEDGRIGYLHDVTGVTRG